MTALAAALTSSLLVAAPAHAHHLEGVFGTSFVDGAGALTDDWGDHYGELGNSLCYGCADSWNTDLVIMWQTILYSEQLLPQSGIDGQFGPGTRDATKRWQTRYGLTADGYVGNATWSKADNFLVWDGNPYGSRVRYIGWNGGQIIFGRGGAELYGEGAYQFASARNAPGVLVNFNSPEHRINFFKKTITVF